LDGTTPDAAKGLVAALHRSVAVQAARVLLGRLALQTQSVAGRSLVLTRALLGSAAGTLAEVVTDAETMSARRRTMVVPSRYEPGAADDCWDTYQREALSMTKELQDCLKSASWWNALEPQICGGIYVIEAEAAFAEYLWCSARAVGSN
jgi:hypothetical protein